MFPPENLKHCPPHWQRKDLWVVNKLLLGISKQLISFIPHQFLFLSSSQHSHPNIFQVMFICLLTSLCRLPWGLSGEESTYQCRRHGFDPWSRRIPQAEEQLSPWARAAELVLQSLGATTTESPCRNHHSPSALEPMLCNKRSRRNEKRVCIAPREQHLLTVTGENHMQPMQQKQIQCSHK